MRHRARRAGLAVTPEHSPEDPLRRLYREVVYLAFRDLDVRTLRPAVVAWVGSEDFRKVAEWAELDESRLAARFRERIAEIEAGAARERSARLPGRAPKPPGRGPLIARLSREIQRRRLSAQVPA